MINKANIEKTNAWPFIEAKKILKRLKGTQKDNDGNIQRMAIKTEANREAGNLNVLLRNDNLRLTPVNNLKEAVNNK